MKDTSEHTGGAFSVRDQFAGTDPARLRPAASVNRAGVSAAPAGGVGLTAAPRAPLRRPTTPDNLLRLIDWAQVARGMCRRAWIVLLLTMIGIALGFYVRIKTGTPRYEARVSVLYRADRQKQTLASSGSGVAVKGLARATAVSLLRRAGTLEKVIAQLKLDMDPADLGWRVQTQSERNSEIILLRVESMPTANLAVAAANAFAQAGLEDNRAFYRNQAIQLAEQFKRQAVTADAEAAAAREALIRFQTKHQLLEVGADTKAFLDGMGAVSERLNAARIARDSQSIRIVNYRRLIQEMPDEVVRESFEDNPLKRRVANAEVALMEARTRYGPQNPRVLQMEDSIREMRRTMSEKTFDETRERVYVRNPEKQAFAVEVLRLEADQEVLDQAVEQVERQAEELKANYVHLPAQQIELAGFFQRHSAASALVQSLNKSVADAQMTADLDLGDFEVLESARSATASRGKLASLLPALVSIFSFFAGVGLCAVLALIDPHLKSAGQVERLYTIPCLGTVPDAPPNAVPQAFVPVCRSLYLRLSGADPSERAPVFCVISACTGDGKSTLAFQAARYWAALGIKTAYLDFDPAPNPWIDADGRGTDIEDYLAGRAGWNETVFMRDDVACLKRQRNAGDLPEQMHGTAMRRLMDTLRAQFGCVIIEAPAWITDAPSAQMLVGMTDYAIWIAASPRSTRPIIGEAFDGLDRAGIRPIGLVLNRGPSTPDAVDRRVAMS
jgi:capsular polysaccharide biosynthesis protein